MWEFISVFVFSLLLAYPLGAYLADVMQVKPMKSDHFFKWIEQPIYAVLGVKRNDLIDEGQLGVLELFPDVFLDGVRVFTDKTNV